MQPDNTPHVAAGQPAVHDADEIRGTTTIHTSMGTWHGGAYLFKVIDAAIWLLTRNCGLESLTINIHPVEGARAPQRYLADQMKRLSRIPKKLPSMRSASNCPVHSASRRETCQPNGLMDRVFIKRESVVLETKAGTITLDRAKGSLFESYEQYARCYATSISTWRKCHKGGKFDAQSFLRAEFDGIPVGDFVASQAMRRFPNAGGSIHRCSGLWQTLFLATAIWMYIKRTFEDPPEGAIVCVPEPTYLSGMYKRLLHHRGAKILDLHDYAKAFTLIPANHSWNLSQAESVVPNPRLVRKCRPAKRKCDLEGIVRAYMDERLADPVKHLPYMTNGTNTREGKLRDMEGRDIELPGRPRIAVLFMHSFDDAQYWFGLDGFDDIYHWTEFTIDRLAAIDAIDFVLVKPHPNSDYERFPGDYRGLQRLLSRFRKRRKVVFLEKSTRIDAIPPRCEMVGVTHHGSVAEELAYLGLPVIASKCAPWGANYSFAHTWSTPEEYLELLARVCGAARLEGPDGARDGLIRYVFECRLTVAPCYKRDAWMKYAQFKYKKTPSMNRDQKALYGAELAALDPSGRQFGDFIAYLVNAHSIENRH